MTSRRSPQGWWTRRAEARQNLQLLPPVKPKPVELPKPRLNVLLKPVKRSEPAAQSRMEKVTGVEKRLMAEEHIEMSKRSSEWGYMKKLVKRGLYRQTTTQGHMVTFQKVSAREQAGRELAAMIATKRGIASQGLAS